MLVKILVKLHSKPNSITTILLTATKRAVKTISYASFMMLQEKAISWNENSSVEYSFCPTPTVDILYSGMFHNQHIFSFDMICLTIFSLYL